MFAGIIFSIAWSDGLRIQDARPGSQDPGPTSEDLEPGTDYLIPILICFRGEKKVAIGDNFP